MYNTVTVTEELKYNPILRHLESNGRDNNQAENNVLSAEN